MNCFVASATLIVLLLLTVHSKLNYQDIRKIDHRISALEQALTELEKSMSIEKKDWKKL